MNQTWVGTYVICLLGYLALGFLLLILFHSLITKYECSHCHHQFKINFFKDLFTIGYKKVKAGFFIDNIASKKVMEKCNMKKIDFEEDITYRDETHHCIYYEITK